MQNLSFLSTKPSTEQDVICFQVLLTTMFTFAILVSQQRVTLTPKAVQQQLAV